MLDHDNILDEMMGGKPKKVIAQPKTKAHFSGKQVALHLAKGEAMKLSVAERIEYVMFSALRGRTFDGCGAEGCQLGVYVGEKYVRMCKRCEGKGEQSTKDRARFNTWAMATKRGVKKTSYVQHNAVNSYGWR